MPLSVSKATCEAVHANKAVKPVAGVAGNIATDAVYIAAVGGKRFLSGKAGKT